VLDNQDRPVNLDYLVLLDLPDHKVLLAQQELEELLVPLEPQGLEVKLVWLDRPGSKDLQDQPELKEVKA